MNVRLETYTLFDTQCPNGYFTRRISIEQLHIEQSHYIIGACKNQVHIEYIEFL